MGNFDRQVERFANNQTERERRKNLFSQAAWAIMLFKSTGDCSEFSKLYKWLAEENQPVKKENVIMFRGKTSEQFTSAEYEQMRMGYIHLLNSPNPPKDGVVW